MTEAAPAISAHGLARNFGAVAAVSGLDLEVRRGEMFGLVGPDGAGKSTAIRLFCGLLRPSGGAATVLGFDLATQSHQIKARIGYLSQSFTLYGDLTVDENLQFFSDLHGVHDFRKRRDELLEFTRLTPFRSRLAQALSGGMKKKLALACTLIHTPEMILLDEPSTGVDPVSRGEFWNILSGVLEQGVTILLTTPYLDEAERCHRVGLMNRGSLMICGTPAEVRAAMPGRLHRLRAPDPDCAYRVLRSSRPCTQVVRYGDYLDLWTARGDEDLGAALASLEAAGCGPVQVEAAPPTLEDAFVALLQPKTDSEVSHETIR